MNIEVIDDFLPKEVSILLNSEIQNTDIKWNNMTNIATHFDETHDARLKIIDKLGLTPTPELYNRVQHLLLYTHTHGYDRVLQQMGYLNPGTPLFMAYEYLNKMLNPQVILRLKINALGGTLERYCDAFHQDQEFDNDCLKYTTAILHLTDSNGATVFEDGTEVECKTNRLIIADGNIQHSSIHQTDTKWRYTFNYNYISGKEDY